MLLIKLDDTLPLSHECPVPMNIPSHPRTVITGVLAVFSVFIYTACATPSPAATPTIPIATPSASPTATQPPSHTPTPTTPPEEERVEEILTSMTTEQKVGQLFVVYFYGSQFSPALEDKITQSHIGGIIIFPHNLTTLTDLAQLVSDAQQTAASNEPHIPLFVAADQEGWPIWRLPEGATVFPSNMALGATGSQEDARLMAEVMAEEMRALGFNMNLAPVMDVNSNPLNPVIGIRSLGSSPELVSRLGAAMIETYQSNGIVAVAKHFPGHGDTNVDSHFDLPLVQHDLERLEAVELPPFQAAISAGVDCIMTAHIHVPVLDPEPDRPATLSPVILQGLLRKKMGFQGLIATDSLGMQGLTSQYDVPRAAVLSFEAGADLLLFGPDPGHPPSEQQATYEKLLRLVEQGSIPMSRLDDSVRRILLVKARRGILDWQPQHLDSALQRVGTAEHLAAAQQVARDSVTLVRDEDNLLPLTPERSILVIYPRGGAGLGQAMLAHAPEAALLQVSERPTWRETIQAVDRARYADLVLVVTSNVLKHPDQGPFVQTLRMEKPVIAVALDSPYDLLSYPEVSTYLATYGRAPVSMEALVDVLLGVEAPRGRLPVELPGLYPAPYDAP
jgi:beta-N-acetylhexosaminidase